MYTLTFIQSPLDLWLPGGNDRGRGEGVMATWIGVNRSPKFEFKFIEDNRLEWPSTHQCTIQKISFWDFMDGMKLSSQGSVAWSVKNISLWNFIHLFLSFPGLPFYLNFSPTNLNPKPYHPSSYQPIYLPHPTNPPSSHSFCNHSITNGLSVWV